MKLAIFATLAAANAETLNHRQVYQSKIQKPEKSKYKGHVLEHWQEQGGNWEHSMEPVDNAVRNGKDFKKDEKFVVWKRCNIHGGTVYKRRGTNN